MHLNKQSLISSKRADVFKCTLHRKVVWNPFSDDLFPLRKTRIPTTLSTNVTRTSKLPMFQQLLGSKPCPVSTYPAYFRPISPNADCCIFSRARFAISKKLPQSIIGRRCAVRKTIGYGWSWMVICTLRTGAAIALMAGRASIWRRCGMRCAPKRRTGSLTNLTRSSLKRAAIRIGSSSLKSFPEPDIMVTTRPPIWGSASCSFYSNDRGRLKLCIWNLSDGLLSRYQIFNPSSPVLLFSLH